MLDLSKFPSFVAVNNEIIDDYRQDDTLYKLQRINVKYGDGKRWGSCDKNLEGIVKNNDLYPDRVIEAVHLYTLYKVLSAKYDVIRDVWVSIERDSDDTEEKEA